LVPHTAAHLRAAAQYGVDQSRVCLHCWLVFRRPVLEDLVHVLWNCPRYSDARESFILDIPAGFGQRLALSPSSARLTLVMSSHNHEIWERFGNFADRVRQLRRIMRTDFERKSHRLSRVSFDIRRREWRADGHKVCRHGVFFKAPPSKSCPRLDQDPDSAHADDPWRGAKLMPRIDQSLKAIVVEKFNQESFARLGLLQAEMRRLAW
jgi:hypothetical protein